MSKRYSVCVLILIQCELTRKHILATLQGHMNFEIGPQDDVYTNKQRGSSLSSVSKQTVPAIYLVDPSHTALASACGNLVVAAIGAGAMRALLKSQLGVSIKLQAACR